MGPGREPKECGNLELISELMDCVEGGDVEFRLHYIAEIERRLNAGMPEMAEDAKEYWWSTHTYEEEEL
jgi:hypothetical protein